MTPPRIPVWLAPCIVLTALLSLYSISYRYKAEEHNKAVTIAVEYETVESYAAAQGLNIDEAFAKLKEQGLSGVVLSEESVSDLLNSGQAVIRNGGIASWRPIESAPRLRRAFS